MTHYITFENKKFLIADGVMFHVKVGRKFIGIEVYMVHTRNDIVYVKYINRGIDPNPMQMPLKAFQSMVYNYFKIAQRRGTYTPRYVPSTSRDRFLRNFDAMVLIGQKALRTLKYYQPRPIHSCDSRQFNIIKHNKEYLCQ